MQPFRIIAFNAVGINEARQEYQCPFMVSFPANVRITQQQVKDVVDSARAQFAEYHPTGKITGVQERTIMVVAPPN